MVCAYIYGLYFTVDKQFIIRYVIFVPLDFSRYSLSNFIYLCGLSDYLMN